MSRLYSAYPQFHFPIALLPTAAQPLTPSYPPGASFPSLQMAYDEVAPNMHLVTPRLCLSLLATATYLGQPYVLREVLAIVLRTVGPATVGRYLEFAIGGGIGEEEWDHQDDEGAKGMEKVARTISSGFTQHESDEWVSEMGSDTASGAYEQSPEQIMVEPAPDFAHRTSTDSVMSDDYAKVSDSSVTRTPSMNSNTTVRPAGSQKLVRVVETELPRSNAPPMPHFYGFVSNKIGEACVCWLARWGLDVLNFETKPDAKNKKDMPIVWGHGGIPAKFVAAILSSDALFVPNERERYQMARRILELRRETWQDASEDLPTPMDAVEEDDWEDEENEIAKVFAEGIYYSHMVSPLELDHTNHSLSRTSLPSQVTSTRLQLFRMLLSMFSRPRIGPLPISRTASPAASQSTARASLASLRHRPRSLACSSAAASAARVSRLPMGRTWRQRPPFRSHRCPSPPPRASRTPLLLMPPSSPFPTTTRTGSAPVGFCSSRISLSRRLCLVSQACRMSVLNGARRQLKEVNLSCPRTTSAHSSASCVARVAGPRSTRSTARREAASFSCQAWSTSPTRSAGPGSSHSASLSSSGALTNSMSIQRSVSTRRHTSTPVPTSMCTFFHIGESESLTGRYVSAIRKKDKGVQLGIYLHRQVSLPRSALVHLLTCSRRASRSRRRRCLPVPRARQLLALARRFTTLLPPMPRTTLPTIQALLALRPSSSSNSLYSNSSSSRSPTCTGLSPSLLPSLDLPSVATTRSPTRVATRCARIPTLTRAMSQRSVRFMIVLLDQQLIPRHTLASPAQARLAPLWSASPLRLIASPSPSHGAGRARLSAQRSTSPCPATMVTVHSGGSARVVREEACGPLSWLVSYRHYKNTDTLILGCTVHVTPLLLCQVSERIELWRWRSPHLL